MMLQTIFVFFISWMYSVEICVERQKGFADYELGLI